MVGCLQARCAGARAYADTRFANSQLGWEVELRLIASSASRQAPSGWECARQRSICR